MIDLRLKSNRACTHFSIAIGSVLCRLRTNSFNCWIEYVKIWQLNGVCRSSPPLLGMQQRSHTLRRSFLLNEYTNTTDDTTSIEDDGGAATTTTNVDDRDDDHHHLYTGARFIIVDLIVCACVWRSLNHSTKQRWDNTVFAARVAVVLRA